MATNGWKKIRVEVSEEKLKTLLRAGQVCAADFNCLDCESKQRLCRLCLESCKGVCPAVMFPESAHDAFCRVCNNRRNFVIPVQAGIR